MSSYQATPERRTKGIGTDLLGFRSDRLFHVQGLVVVACFWFVRARVISGRREAEKEDTTAFCKIPHSSMRRFAFFFSRSLLFFFPVRIPPSH